MKKKDFYGFVFAIVAVIYFLKLASAFDSGQIGQQLTDFYVSLFEPILAALFGGWDLGGLYLFEKFLLFVMLVALIYTILGRVELFTKNKFVIWITAIIIPLIAVRFINIEQIETIIFAYKWVAIVLTTVLPFLIYFYFIYSAGKDSGILRKVLWILFIGIYIGIYSSSSNIDSNIYIWTLIASVICLIFDGLINRRLSAMQLMKADKYFKNSEITAINYRIHQLEQSLLNGTAYDRKATQDEIKDLRKHRNWMTKQ